MAADREEQWQRLSEDDEPEREAVTSDRIGPHSPAVADIGLTKTPSTSRGALDARKEIAGEARSGEEPSSGAPAAS